ncbi:hypothetical protein EMIHUDRAFT_120042, partial [Emiliania huxleyi CCMP1516]|uniref:EF-hand domain-containing protein n=2 Tax=Emiliania huxleyi TaxID=2903 RepID=A0A0D3INA0_EMIH1
MFFAVLSSILLGASVPLNHTTPDNTAPVPAVPSENDFASENTSVAAEYFALVDADGDGILTANENRRLPWQEDEAPGVGELHGFPSWYDSNDGKVTLAEDDGQGTLAVDGAAELEEEVDEEVEASATESQLFVASTQGDYADIPSFSEEQGWSDPSNYGVITGVRCSGKYCDSMQLKASQIESTNYSSALTTYTEWFSEENSGSGKCAPDYVVTAVKCKGRYCDSLRLRCNKLKSGGRWTSEEYETSKFSSSRRQSGIGECYKPSTSVIGIKCFGDYCGQKNWLGLDTNAAKYLTCMKMYIQGGPWPKLGTTMAGHKRLQNVATLLLNARSASVAGSYVECGVWRGGMSIFAKAVIEVYQMQRRVYLCDSFQGLPPPRSGSLRPDETIYASKKFNASLAKGEDTVTRNFYRFGVSMEG